MRPWERPSLLKPDPPTSGADLKLSSFPPWEERGLCPPVSFNLGLCSATHTPASANSYFQERTSENHTFGSSSCKFSFKRQTLRRLRKNRTKSRQVPSAPTFAVQERNVTYSQERDFVKLGKLRGEPRGPSCRIPEPPELGTRRSLTKPRRLRASRLCEPIC